MNMKMKRLGRTGLMVTENSFGALPIQRIPESESTAILRAAYEAGINFYDTANAYTDSEFKLGQALGDVRRNIIIATKTAPAAPDIVYAARQRDTGRSAPNAAARSSRVPRSLCGAS